MELFDASILAKQLISQYIPQYSFAWMNEKRTNGRCSYRTRTILLSKPLTRLRTEEAVRITIMHEIAHALTPGSKHGDAWRMQMWRFGLPPNRCSQDDVDTSSISNWQAKCVGCKKVYHMIRKPRVDRACSQCCKGKYNPAYVLTYTRM